MMRSLFAALLIISLVSAIHVLSPVDREVSEGDTIYIGEIGPGQTIPIEIVETVTTGGVYSQGGVYDQAVFDRTPPGWSGVESKIYALPLHVTLTADPKAKEGEYRAKIIVVDERNADGLGNVSFWVKLNVTYDVMDAAVQPTAVKTGPGQPARFEITIDNKGATGDLFEVSSIGAKRWEFKKDVFVPAKSSKKIFYEIVGNEEEVYNAQLSVVSKASSIIHEEKNITVDVRSDILGDMKATNNGVIVFPIFESLIYSFFGLISNLY